MVINVSSFRIFLKTFVISGWCLVLFIGLGYYYIDSQNIKVQNEAESVPYYSQIPESKGVLLTFGTRSVYMFFDFESSAVKVVINPENVEDMGYTVDYTVEADYGLISDICDYFGGVNLTIDAETLRYTGGQVTDLLSYDISDELRVKSISAVFERIAEQGIGADFFNMIITESKTDMKMPDCYFWTDFMDDISKNVKFLSDN